MDALPIGRIELDADTLTVFGDELQPFVDPHGGLIAPSERHAVGGMMALTV